MKACRIILSLLIISLVCALPLSCGKDETQKPTVQHDQKKDDSGGQSREPGQDRGARKPPGTELASEDNLTRVAVSARVWKYSGPSYYRIYKISGDDFKPVWLTPDGCNCCNPVWSPRGNRIAFFTDISGITGIGVVNADGPWDKRDLIRATSLGRGGSPPVTVSDKLLIWSPDGTKVIYGAEAQDGNLLQVVALDPDALSAEPLGTVKRGRTFNVESAERFFPVDPWDRSIALSPDGRYKVDLKRGLRRVIEISGSNGSREVALPEVGPAFFRLGDWSPDAGQIIVECEPANEGAQPGIYILDAQAGALRKLCNGLDGHWTLGGDYVIYRTPEVETPFDEADRGLIDVKCSVLSIIPGGGGTSYALMPGPMNLRGHSTAFVHSRETTTDFAGIETLPSPSAVRMSPSETGETPGPRVEHHAPEPVLPPGKIKFHILGEFVSDSGFTAFTDMERDGRTEIVVAGEIASGKYEVTTYALRGGKYALAKRHEASAEGEEEKYRSKFADSPVKELTAGQGGKFLPPEIADRATMLWAGQAAVLNQENPETLVCYLVRENDSRWKAFLSIFGNTAGTDYKEIGKTVALEGKDDIPRNANATLVDIDGDGKKELVLALTTPLDEGWRENLKIYSISAE